MLRLTTMVFALAVPLAVAAQPVMPGQPLGQPPGPQDSDILRRSQRALPEPAPMPPPAATTPGALGSLVQPDGRIVVTRDMCRQASVQHQPAPDVAYRGGTDVYGRPVAPADLPGSGASAYGGLGSQSSTDLLIRPQAATRSGVAGETYVGRVTVDASGRTVLNGQPIDPGTQSELRQLCARAGY
ncbi:MAG: hypothetical protein HY060_14440 [Proteobacteria bacterium]|nr:hypothetical protein [Pseudomonadota bacterium]